MNGCIYALTCKPLPKIKGEVIVPGLKDKVRIIRDAHGTPHIFAKTEDDSYIALGYVHAQDRLWQMHMLRHLTQGRLSELVGVQEIDNPMFSAKTTIDLDYYNRVMGFKYLAERATERLDPRSMEILKRYASGINLFAEQNAKRLPAEFVLLGLDFEPWRPEDTIALYSYIAWNLNNDWHTELLRYTLAGERGQDKALEVLPLHSDPGPFILEELDRGSERIPQPIVDAVPSGAVSRGFADLLNMSKLIQNLNLSIGFAAASNNWVVSGKKTSTGKPILCNDPHLPLTVPSIWYQIHINRPGMDVIGVMFPGTPAIGIGRNRHIAWGNTTPFEDSMDLFIEKANPGNAHEYLYKGTYQQFDTRIEKIYCKQGRRMIVIVKSVRMTVHGPIINDVIPSLRDSKELLAVKWTAYDLDYRTKGLKILKLGEATNWEEFTHFIDIGIPLFNWVYADVQGNIGYATPGLLPLRAKGDGTYPVPGWTGEYDWHGFLPVEDVPRTYNPARGYVVTANNQVFPEGAYPYIFSKRYMPSYRAARIRELLLQKDTLDVEDMKKIQADVYSKQGERLAKYFVEAYETSGDKADPTMKRAAETLKDWDYQCGVDSVGAAIFHLSYNVAFENILKDEMSEEIFKVYKEDLAIETSFDNLLEKTQSDLFDDKRTETHETKHDILYKSLRDAVSLLKADLGSNVDSWKWGKIHSLDMEHITFGQVKFLRSIFNIGTFQMPGSRHTVNNAFYGLGDRQTCATFSGSSFREINDMSDPERMVAILSAGQSGHRLSKHYKDQTDKWLRGDYNELHMDLNEILKEAEGELILSPGK